MNITKRKTPPLDECPKAEFLYEKQIHKEAV